MQTKQKAIGCAVGMAVALAVAVGGEGTAPAQVREEAILSDPYADKFLGMDYRPGTIDPKGAALRRSRRPGDPSDLWFQKIAWYAIALGVGRQEPRFIEDGIRALEYGFSRINPDGRFPDVELGAGGRFLLSYAMSYFLVRDSWASQQYLDRLNAVVPKAVAASHHLLNAPRFQHEQKSIHQFTNQGLGLATLFKGIGVIAGDPILTAKGHEYYRWALGAQMANGVFPERGGFDSSYQAVSLQFLMYHYLYLAEDKQEAFDALRKGWAWELGRISGSGEVSVEGNTRTGAKQEFWRGQYKGVNYKEVSLALVYWSHLSGEASLTETARRVIEYATRLRR